ncbi:MAG TPA: GNVR domain-containing protein [Vicinamibacterales bacterium]|jgi:polysaccharide chain length determinant protein (PEP-CTERM system associated)
MLPARSYTPSAIVWILRKRQWLMIGPFIVFSVTAAYLSLALPDRYRASTLILVTPQRVPENYVRPAVTETIEQRLASISPQILSETRLERIIEELDLYPKERQKKGGLQSVIEDLRDDIKVDIIKGDLFRVTYSGEEPYKVMQVTQRLASLFVQENLKDREQLAVGTNEFLDSQLQDARRRLEEQEKKLQEYRQAHSGELPSQVGANLQVLQTASMQLQTIDDSLGRDHDRRMELEHALLEFETKPAAAAPAAAAGSDGAATPAPAAAQGDTVDDNAAAGDPPPLNVPNARTATAAVRLQIARRQLEAMQIRLKPDHPDLMRAKRQLAELEAAVAQEIAKGTGLTVPTDPAEVTRMARAAQIRVQLAALDKEMGRKTAEQTRLRQVVATFQQRVEGEPARESELTGLTRDYDTIRETYRSLLAKKEESGIAANLERQQVSQQFKTLDPARLPERPYAPNRPMIALVGAGMGFALGLGLTILLELRDQSFRAAPEVVQVLSLPVLALVPGMITRYEQRQMNKRLALSFGIILMGVALTGGYFAFRNWW